MDEGGEKLRKIIREEIRKVLESVKDFYHVRTPKGWLAVIDDDSHAIVKRRKADGWHTRKDAKKAAKKFGIEDYEIRRVSSKNIQGPGVSGMRGGGGGTRPPRF